jgi:hypothetical protein
MGLVLIDEIFLILSSGIKIIFLRLQAEIQTRISYSIHPSIYHMYLKNSYQTDWVNLKRFFGIDN